MANLLEFSALHYNTNRFSQIQDILCSPSGSLTVRDIEELKGKSNYNYVHLLFPEGNGDEFYRNRTKTLYGWLLRDILLVDDEPAFYLYEQEFIFEGQRHMRYGLIALVGLEGIGDNILSAKKAPEDLVERNLRSFSESQSVFENTVFLYEDKEKTIETKLAEFATEDYLILKGKDSVGNIHRLYRVKGKDKISDIKGYFEDKKLYVGEGQANIEAAVRYKAQQQAALGESYTGKESFNYLMGIMINTEDIGFKAVPSHRLIKKQDFDPLVFLKEVQKHYKLAAIELTDDIRLIKAARIKLKKVIRSYMKQGKCAFGLYFKRIPSKYFVLVLKDEAKSMIDTRGLPEEFAYLAPNVLSQTLLKPVLDIDEDEGSPSILYHQNEDWVLDAVRRGDFDLAFILGELDPKVLVESADAGLILPVKMLEFYPEVLSGITAYSWKYSKC